MSGEIISFLDILEFKSKKELLDKLREIRESTINMDPHEREIIRKMLSVAVQEVYYTGEQKLLKYKNFSSKQKNK